MMTSRVHLGIKIGVYFSGVMKSVFDTTVNDNSNHWDGRSQTPYSSKLIQGSLNGDKVVFSIYKSNGIDARWHHNTSETFLPYMSFFIITTPCGYVKDEKVYRNNILGIMEVFSGPLEMAVLWKLS